MPIPTQTGTPKIGLAVWNALAAFVNSLEAAIAQKASSGDLASHMASTAAHGATSSPTPSTPVRRDIDGGTTLTALALTDTTPTAGQAVRRDYVDTTAMIVVKHGFNAGIVRPPGAAAVLWVGEVTPANMTAADIYNGPDA